MILPKMKEIYRDILHGDCTEVLLKFPANHFDLIVISSTYADSRARTYCGIKPDKYVEWFLPKTAGFLRGIKPAGTFVLNITAIP